MILWELRGLYHTFLVIFNKNKNILDHESILARVVVMNGNVTENQYHPLVMTSATSGSVMVEVPDGDNQVLLVVSAVPEYFKSHQTYGYQARITTTANTTGSTTTHSTSTTGPTTTGTTGLKELSLDNNVLCAY